MGRGGQQELISFPGKGGDSFSEEDTGAGPLEGEKEAFPGQPEKEESAVAWLRGAGESMRQIVLDLMLARCS